LQSVAPPIGSAPVMAVMAGLDGGFALVVSVAATVLAVVTLPPMLDAFAGIAVEIEPARLALRLLALIGGAVVVASLIRRLAGHRLAALAPEVGGVTVIVMVLFAIAVMDGLVATAVADPMRVIRLTLVAIVAATLWAGIACLITWRLAGPTRALTFGLLAGNRNLGLVLGALGAAAPGEFTVYLAVAQLPIYLVPAVFGALARLAIRSRSPS
jgi:BASS family bile acid:Na+ symporter